MSQSSRENIANLLMKLDALDHILKSLGGVHEENKDKIEEMHKKISTRKLVLMDELYKLLSNITV